MIALSQQSSYRQEANMPNAKGPLRQITERLFYPPASLGWFAKQKVLLECGHEVWCSTATTYRARCRHCATANSRRLDDTEKR